MATIITETRTERSVLSGALSGLLIWVAFFAGSYLFTSLAASAPANGMMAMAAQICAFGAAPTAAIDASVWGANAPALVSNPNFHLALGAVLWTLFGLIVSALTRPSRRHYVA